MRNRGQMGMEWVKRKKRVCFFDLGGGRGFKGFSAYEQRALNYFATKYEIPVMTRGEDLGSYEVVLFSVHSFRDYYRVSEVSGYKKKGQEWIAGGNAVTAPAGVMWIMDYVFVGDGREAMPRILEGGREMPGMIRVGVTREVEYQDLSLRPEAISPREIEMSKGCPRRCLFCIHPWRTEYEEQDKEVVFEFVRSRKGSGVGLSSNSSDDVSYYGEATKLLQELNKADMVISNAVQGLTEEVVKVRRREILMGVEGVSGFLRWVINKPIHRGVLYEKLELLFREGRSARTIYQFNLPGEEERDFAEFLEDVAYFRKKFKKGSWAIPFIPNQGTAHTPLQFEKPRYDVSRVEVLMELRKSLFGSGKEGMSVYMPAVLYPSKWFQQIIGEWIGITPKVAAAMKSMPEKLSVEEMVAWCIHKDVEVPPTFLERGEQSEYPWDFVKIRSSREDLLKRRRAMYARMGKRDEYDQRYNEVKKPLPIAYEV